MLFVFVKLPNMGIKYYVFGLFILILTIYAVCFTFSTTLFVSLEEVYPADVHFREGLHFLSRDSLEEAENAFKKAIACQKNFALNHYYLAEIYVRQKRFQEAAAVFSRTIEIDPEFYPAFYNLGTLLGEKGAYRDAIAVLNRAVVLNPRYIKAYQKLAQLYLETGDFNAAERIYDVLKKLEKAPVSE